MHKTSVALLILLLMAACTGDRGPSGPQGDQGPTGQTGPQGPQGVSGTPVFWDDFEADAIASPPWRLRGDAAWFVVPNSTYSPYGSNYITSGVVADNQSSRIQLHGDFGQGGVAVFYAAVGSQIERDWLFWTIDNHVIDGISGSSDWRTFTFPVPPGEHTLEWVYIKDGSGATGVDRAWMDALVILNCSILPKKSVLPKGAILWSEYQDAQGR